MPGPELHIVSFDIPYPPDYGGAIDVFYKIKSLSEAGCRIYLHCYEYGRQRQPVLETLCKQVWYYPRPGGLTGLSLTQPFIVASRRGDELLQRLAAVDAPILFEGVHTTYFLSHPLLKDRLKMVRTQNVENEYYRGLSGRARSLVPRVYFFVESLLLRKYEHSLSAANAFLSVSLYDQGYFAKAYPGHECLFVPSFHPYDTISISPGTGQYALYHGNLAHPENIEVVDFLLKEVIPNSETPFIIAGRNAGVAMKTACSRLNNCTLVDSPDNETMDRLIRDAQVHVLPTFQESGIKLKLLSSLFAGRHILANKQMLYGTDLAPACHLAASGAEFANKIDYLSGVPFTEADVRERSVFMERYRKSVNAQQIIDLLSRYPSAR